MDISQESDPKSQEEIPVLSSYVKNLESHVRERYLKKISVVGVDPAAIPSEQFSSECLPPIEVSDLLSYLVLETSYYTNKQFKAFKSLEAYNQMVSGFVASVQGKEIAGKIVVVAKVRHSQRMNDPLVNIWIIVEKDGTIISAHCLGCKAGLAESCSHVASVMFYIEAVTRIQGKLACTQAKCTWILPTYVNEVPYAKVRDIDFSSAKKLKSALEQKIETSHQNTGEGSLYHDSVVIEVEEQTNDLLGGRLIALDPKPVQQQTNGSDCGVFAVAFATCLVFGVDPTFINFDAQGMRPHLATCLRNGRISLFPSF